MKNKGILIVFSGPSGSGKGTILHEVMADNPAVMLSVSATTRSPREGEQNGVNYFFLGKKQFEEMITGGGMLEHASYCGNYYGTPRKPVEDAMLETLYEANGVGLAAPQVGILRRVVVIDVGDGPVELVNPEVIEKHGVQKEMEGCLSCPGVWGITKRPLWVKVRAQDRLGIYHEYEGQDLLARAFCHEIDHLDGIMFRSHIVEYIEPDPED